MISFSGRRSFPPTGFRCGLFVGIVTVGPGKHLDIGKPFYRQTTEDHWTRDALMNCILPTACPLPSHDGPRSLVQAGVYPTSRVSLHLENFPSSDEHSRRQMSQMSTKWSGIGQRNPSQNPQALSTLSLIVLRERCYSPESSSQRSSPSQRRCHRISGRTRETHHEQRPLLRRYRRRPTLPDRVNHCRSCLF
jgi:hypothetical protein